MKDDAHFDQAAAEALLELAVEMPWSEITLSVLANRMDRPVSDFLGLTSFDELIEAYLDRACGAEEVDDTETLRERLFDIAMLRFEAMENHRQGIMAWQESWLRNPLKRARAARQRTKSARWILLLAGEPQNAALKPKSVILSGILFRAEQAWRQEEGADFSRTMAQLDRDLRDVDSWVERIRTLSFLPGGKKKAADFSAAV